MRMILSSLCFILAAPFSFAEKTANTTLHPTAQAMNKAYQTGTELSIKKAMQEGQVPPEFGKCILSKNEYTDIYIRLLGERLTKPELKIADNFYSSPAGIKYLQHGLFQLYEMAKATPDFEQPEINESTLKSIDSYQKSSAGIKLAKQQVLYDAAAQAELKKKTDEIIGLCRT